MICVRCHQDKPPERFVRKPDGTPHRHCSQCQSDDVSRREREQRAGTWIRQRYPAPVVPPPATEVAWAAGFLDGEGHFCTGRIDGRVLLRVKASQINPEPLYRLRDAFGGSVREERRLTTAGNPVWRWQCSGQTARIACDLLLPYLCSTKAAQARRAMEVAA